MVVSVLFTKISIFGKTSCLAALTASGVVLPRYKNPNYAKEAAQPLKWLHENLKSNPAFCGDRLVFVMLPSGQFRTSAASDDGDVALVRNLLRQTKNLVGDMEQEAAIYDHKAKGGGLRKRTPAFVEALKLYATHWSELASRGQLFNILAQRLQCKLGVMRRSPSPRSVAFVIMRIICGNPLIADVLVLPLREYFDALLNSTRRMQFNLDIEDEETSKLEGLTLKDSFEGDKANGSLAPTPQIQNASTISFLHPHPASVPLTHLHNDQDLYRSFLNISSTFASLIAIAAATFVPAAAWWATQCLLPCFPLARFTFSPPNRNVPSAGILKVPVLVTSNENCPIEKQQIGDQNKSEVTKPKQDSSKSLSSSSASDDCKARNQKKMDRSSCESNTTSSSEVEAYAKEKKHEKCSAAAASNAAVEATGGFSSPKLQYRIALLKIRKGIFRRTDDLRREPVAGELVELAARAFLISLKSLEAEYHTLVLTFLF
ncbi:hypothetical protein ZIOFF_068410 [Zingiber officinale]|uniref:Uncharacterized protein n=1 Tax=Zingiber officinale TaxID=94328 RepID=A0A8J5CY62_ZINOF|nr:hypothetical protein ZIOFF_068410 [Zingiber officinale]